MTDTLREACELQQQLLDLGTRYADTLLELYRPRIEAAQAIPDALERTRRLAELQQAFLCELGPLQHGIIDALAKLPATPFIVPSGDMAAVAEQMQATLEACGDDWQLDPTNVPRRPSSPHKKPKGEPK